MGGNQRTGVEKARVFHATRLNDPRGAIHMRRSCPMNGRVTVTKHARNQERYPVIKLEVIQDGGMLEGIGVSKEANQMAQS